MLCHGSCYVHVAAFLYVLSNLRNFFDSLLVVSSSQQEDHKHKHEHKAQNTNTHYCNVLISVLKSLLQ